MGVTARPRRLARRLVDRALVPHVTRITDHIDAVADLVTHDAHSAHNTAIADPAGVPSDFFHNLLHAARTSELRRLHGSAQRVLSVGASGSWYFHWFEESVGPLERHIGVEAFEPKPADLPDNVTWIASSADRFDGVDDESIDMVFAGQTTEHLWSNELAEFMLESHRVLTPGGQIVLDSPNRLVTEHMSWSHGGHTVELSADEIADLLELAGFEVISSRGVWRSAFDGHVLALEDGLDRPDMLVRRISEAADRPDDSFVWWVVARRNSEPQPARLHNATTQLYQQHWPTRISRGMWPGPPEDGIDLEPGSPTISSLPVYLRAGTVRLVITLSYGRLDDASDWTLQLTTPGQHVVQSLPLAAANRTDTSAAWQIDIDQLTFAAAIEIHVADLNRPVRVEMPIAITAGWL